MHQSRIRDIFVIDISKHVDIYDNLICVTEAEGLGIILVNCRLFATLVLYESFTLKSLSKQTNNHRKLSEGFWE